MAQCKGEQLKCSKCGLGLKRNEYDDHLFCHSLESQEENPQEHHSQEDYSQDQYLHNQNVSKYH